MCSFERLTKSSENLETWSTTTGADETAAIFFDVFISDMRSVAIFLVAILQFCNRIKAKTTDDSSCFSIFGFQLFRVKDRGEVLPYIVRTYSRCFLANHPNQVRQQGFHFFTGNTPDA